MSDQKQQLQTTYNIPPGHLLIPAPPQSSRQAFNNVQQVVAEFSCKQDARITLMESMRTIAVLVANEEKRQADAAKAEEQRQGELAAAAASDVSSEEVSKLADQVIEGANSEAPKPELVVAPEPEPAPTA